MKNQELWINKLWDLHIHCEEMKKAYSHEWNFDLLPEVLQRYNKYQQQIGKIVILSVIINKEHGREHGIVKKIWDLRRWQLDDTGDHIIIK